MSAFFEAVESALVWLSKGKAPAALRTLAVYGAQIVSIRANGSADIATDDLAVGGDGGLGGRPILVGLPGIKLALSGGDRVRVGFEGGSPSSAECLAFEQDKSADKGIARVDDIVKIGTWSYVAGVGPPSLTITFTPIDGSTPTVVVLLGTITSGPAPIVPHDVNGKIMTGSEEVLLR